MSNEGKEAVIRGVPVTPLGIEAQSFSINIESKAFPVFWIYALAIPYYVLAENELLLLSLHFKHNNTSFLSCLPVCNPGRLLVYLTTDYENDTTTSETSPEGL